MSSAYLFRIDGAKDNDEFFATMSSSVSQVYAGVDIHLGTAGWIPDLIKVVVEGPDQSCSLTIIELEAIESAALISCRKYLPEDSADILSAFSDYLDRVIRQCRTNADPRKCEFIRLKSQLTEATHVTINTAGGLRNSSTGFVEELPLIDQPKLATQPRRVQQDHYESRRPFQGLVRLTRREAEALARCVMILDAVIRGHDHSGTRFELWRRRARSQPMKRLLTENNGSHPELRSLVFGSKERGITLDFEKVLSELIDMWTTTSKRQPDREQTRRLIDRYFPVVADIKGYEPMVPIFETARKCLSDEGIQ
jgi:hypothetical protein